jgi:hypothetical protein
MSRPWWSISPVTWSPSIVSTRSSGEVAAFWQACGA